MTQKHVHYLENGMGYEVYGPPTPVCDPTKCDAVQDKHDWKPYASTELSAYQWCLHCLKVRRTPEV